MAQGHQHERGQRRARWQDPLDPHYQPYVDGYGPPVPPAWVKLVKPFWQDYALQPEYDVRRLQADFETHAAAIAERQKRINLLRKGGPRSQELGEYLAAFNGEIAPVTCCPATVRQFRIWAVSEVLRIFSGFDDVRLLTLFFPEEDVPFGSLHTVDWARIDMRVRRQIERALSPYTLVVGSKEVDADYQSRTWRVHMHLLAANCSEAERANWRRRHFRPRSGRDGLMQVDAVQDLARQIAYAFKLIAFRRPFKQVGPSRSKGKRLRTEEHNEFVEYLASHKPTEFMFVFNADRRNGKYFKISRRVLDNLIVAL